MSWHPVNIALCPHCGRDVAQPLQFAPTLRWSVVCDPDRAGCGARGAFGDTEAEAVTIWNVGLISRPQAQGVTA